MKKFLFIMFSVVLSFASCTKNKNSQENVVENDTTAIETVDTVLNVEDIISIIISMDNSEMKECCGDNYRWYETCILLKNYLDSEDASSEPEMVVNVFQTLTEKDGGFDTQVYKFQHFASGLVDKECTHGFWVEDYPLNDEEITLTYQEAYDRIMAANFPKPHSRNCVMRKPIGPVICGTQYIFGNLQEQLWVDAFTGDVTNKNPAFPDDFEYMTAW